MTRKPLSFNLGFTIVELLIVMVIIGIVATVTLISYSGISSKAIAATLQSDLQNASTQIKLFYSEKGYYPNANNCPSPGNNEVCLKSSSTDTILNYVPGAASNATTYTLTATNGTVKYQVANDAPIIETPSVVTNGLVLNLDAANPASYPGTGTTWYDLSGSGYNGTLTNGATFDSGFGGSFVFNGTSSLVSTSNNISPSQITISAWVNRTGSSSNQGMVRKNFAYALSLYGNYVQVAPGNSWRFYSSGVQIPLSTWLNIVWTYNGTNMYIYKNGDLAWAMSLSGALPSNAATTNIGYDENGWYWAGKISNVTIYGRGLSQSEITQNFNALRGRYGI